VKEGVVVMVLCDPVITSLFLSRRDWIGLVDGCCCWFVDVA